MGSPAGSGPASVAGTSRYPKLDGVLYHFYAKTSAVITSCRLTHFEGSEHLGGSSSTSSRQLRQLRRNSSESASAASTATNPGINRTASTSGSTGRKVSKWFALDIDDQDVFRDEIRLWRNISTLIPNWLLDQPPSTLPHQGAAYVPPMFLDIVLDTSNLTSNHVLMIDELQEDRRTRRRVRVDGQDTGSSPRRSGERLEAESGKDQRGRDEALDIHRESIILESWRLDFAIHNPPNPPDLPTLYKHATAHFREAYGFVTDLPTYALHKRLKQIWESNLERRRARTHENNANDLDEEQDEDDELANLLKVGVRMAIGRPGETEEGHIGLREPVGSMMHSSDGSGRVTRSYSFAPILTPIGSLSFSVEYRRNVDFYVEDWHVIQSMREIALDEDYFKPTMAKHLQRRASVQRQRQNSQGSLSSSPASLGDKRSLLSQTSNQKTGEEQQSSGQLPLDTTAQRATPSTPSVFGTSLGSTSGRPVAGLSNLRASPSVAGYSASPATATLGALPGTGNSGTSSPALSSALASDAAFLTHARRPSISSGSERRLRSFTSLSTGQDKESPPSPSVSGRPILSRASISNAFPRSGSYSPSSPSPLAQQMYAQQAAAALANANAQGGGRLSSSPSFRASGQVAGSGGSLGFPGTSISPSLRSVFQSYTPSQSQTSISSLSRTPPRSLLENPIGSIPTSSQINPSRSGDGQPLQTNSTSTQQPSVAPQMIKRYNSGYSYRQNRQTSYIGSDGGSLTGGGQGVAVGGSSIGSGAGTGGGGLYSRSWQTRFDQRPAFVARSLGREEGSNYSPNSPLSMRRPLHSENAGPDEDLDDLVRMIESRPTLGNPGITSTSESIEDHSKSPQESNLSSGTSRAITRLHEYHPTIGSSPMQVSSIASSAFPRNRGFNRTQVDEMLQKMQNSVREYSTSLGTSRSSPASGGHATSSSGGGQSQPDHSPPIQHGGMQSTSFTRSPLSRGSYSATTSTKSAVAQDSISARKNVPMEAIARGDGTESRDVSVSNTHDRLLAAAPNVASARQEVTDIATINTDASRNDEDNSNAKRDSREEARLSHSHPGRSQSRGSLELYAPHSYDPLDDETAGRLELANDESLTELRNAQAHGRQGLHGISGIGGNYANNNVDEESRRRQENMELARNFTNTVSNRGGNGRSASTTGRTSMSPWRQRGFHPAPSGTVTNSPGDIHSTHTTHFHSAHPYHHAHQSHLNASRHAQTTNTTNTPPPNTFSPANRSGRSSAAQPSSPAGSPPMD
ncbi:hypothetical protein L7F22_039325 [Adiantum nelumboides]|nr:hypothetical protein [Adiantum nelumboides]